MSVVRERGVGFAEASAIVIRKIADTTPRPIKKAVSRIITDAVMRSPKPIRDEVLNVTQDPEELLQHKIAELNLNRDKLPRTVAIIPDGNRRYAREHGLTIEQGHELGAKVLYESLSVFHEFNEEIENVILWAWSEDNEVGRPQEKSGVFGTIAKYLKEYAPELAERNCRITSVGRTDRFGLEGVELAKELRKAKEMTSQNTGTNIILAIDYGERYEDERFATGLRDVSLTEEYVLSPEAIAMIRADSRAIPVPDLVVRTSGEMRLSGFPYANAAELYFIDTKLPGLIQYQVAEALLEYTRRDVRKGK